MFGLMDSSRVGSIPNGMDIGSTSILFGCWVTKTSKLSATNLDMGNECMMLINV